MSYSVAIIGGGFSGLGVARELVRAGFDDFVVLEKGSELGGTWRDNVYPGCACDVPSTLYSFSWAPNPDWTHFFAPQPEIQRYLLGVAAQLDLGDRVRRNTEVLKAEWVGDHWQIETNNGELQAEVLVSGAGFLHAPRIPALPGLDDFAGTVIHTATWRHDVDLSGNVAVIGTGSSGIQLVPEIQPHCGTLTLFQRTPGWVLPKPDFEVSPRKRRLYRRFPPAQRLQRTALYYLLELLQKAQRRPRVMERLQRIGLRHLEAQVADPTLRQALTPTFALGCKRLLLSNTYYPALQQPNVRFVPHAVSRFTAGGAVDATGAHHPLDTVVFATGFRVTDAPVLDRIVGQSGLSLAEVWQGSPHAYLGTSVPDFPNFAMMLGPNLGNGHTSALVLIEAQARYLVKMLQTMKRRRLPALDVRAPVEHDWNEAVQRGLQGTVWNAGGCASWYLDDNGTNRAIYPWSTLDLRRRLGSFELAAYEVPK